MNRRDLIIVAVLINCGLLIALFIGAVKSDRDTDLQLSHAQVVQEIPQKETASAQETSQGGDQIDQMLSQYSAKLAEKEKPTVTLPAPVLTPKVATEAELPKVALAHKSNDSYKSVTVQKGDVLEKIARLNGVKVDDIMKLNSLEDSRLQIGQVLKLPPKTDGKAPIRKGADASKYYIVKGGDNPWTIAQKNNMQVEELLRLNNMDEAKAKRLRPGDKLKIK